MNHLDGRRVSHDELARASGKRTDGDGSRRTRFALILSASALAAALVYTQAPAYDPGSSGLPGIKRNSGTTLRNGTSSNWGGEIAHNAEFASVQATWTVPTLSCRNNESNSSTYAWVGMGGWDGMQALEQIGTAHWCDAGQPTYGLFGEFYSAPPFAGDGSVFQPGKYPVAPGDVVTATVTKVNDSGEYQLGAVNETAHWHFSRSGQSPDFDPGSDPGNLTGEVIMEPPHADSNPKYTPTIFTDISYTAETGSPVKGLFDTVPGRGTVEQTSRLSEDSITTTWVGY